MLPLRTSDRRAAARVAAALTLGLAFVLAPPARGEEPAATEKEKARAATFFERVERHAVIVTIRFQKDLDAEARGVEPVDARSIAERYRAWRMSYVVPGFVFRDRRTVIAADTWLPPGAIASATIRPLQGPEVRARLRGFLRRAEAIVFETEVDLAAEPVPFPERMTVTTDTPLFAGSVVEGNDGFEAWFEGLGGVRRRPVGRKGFAYGAGDADGMGIEDDADLLRSVDLVTDERGTPLGFRFGASLSLKKNLWMGPDLLEDEEIPFAVLEGMARSGAHARTLHRVKVQFRTQDRHDRRRNPFSGDDVEADAEFWGFAVTPDTLVVPGRMDDEAVRRIERVRIRDDERTPGTPATYAGRVRGWEAFVVKVQGGGLDVLPPTKPAVPDAGHALLFHRVAWRGGARRDQVDYNRVLGWTRGYGDKSYLVTERGVSAGALLLDGDGAVLGFAARLDPIDREHAPESRPRHRDAPRFPVVAVLFDEVGPPASLVENPDVRVMPAAEEEAERMPWLGVVYDGITPGVAELMRVSEPTRDGTRGLVVTRVYDGSPAKTVGIREDDVLLWARRTSGPGSDAPPVDLTDQDEEDVPYFIFGFSEGAPAPWRSASGPLERLLRAWGVGTTYEIGWLSGEETRTASLTVELGPPNFDSAPRASDTTTGLHVRDLTYEVRGALRLDASTPGAVVERVEPGSACAQARIEENEIVLEFDGRPVAGAAAFQSMLEQARAQGRDRVRLAVLRLGKTRMVDLAITAEACAPADAPSEEAEEDGGDEATEGEDTGDAEDAPPAAAHDDEPADEPAGAPR
jgi:hypothetical protein